MDLTLQPTSSLRIELSPGLAAGEPFPFAGAFVHHIHKPVLLGRTPMFQQDARAAQKVTGKLGPGVIGLLSRWICTEPANVQCKEASLRWD